MAEGAPTVPPPTRATLMQRSQQCRQLSLYAQILADPIGAAFQAVLEHASASEATDLPLAFTAACAKLSALLAAETELQATSVIGDAWQNHLLSAVLTADNAFSRKAQQTAGTLSAGLTRLTRHDLRLLQDLFTVNGSALRQLARDAGRHDALPYLHWEDFQPAGVHTNSQPDALTLAKQRLAQMRDWGEAIPVLVGHYRRHGVGIFARFRALRWVPTAQGGRLEGIAHPDPIRLEDLIGDERQRRLLVQNTEQFLAGYRANHVLLFGDRGTGKSSSIKALLNRYAHHGLRLVEVHKEDLGDLPQLCGSLREQPHRFILFVDDLSFEPHETYYKALKALLEGSVEEMPGNVVIYATSNRGHLIRERFADRAGLAEGEVHPQETLHELFSLSDRFGIRLTFVTPTQAQYLAIVDALARQHHLPIPVQELHARAVTWAQQQNGFSGRTARQFVDFLEGELGLAAGAVQTAHSPAEKT